MRAASVAMNMPLSLLHGIQDGIGDTANMAAVLIRRAFKGSATVAFRQ